MAQTRQKTQTKKIMNEELQVQLKLEVNHNAFELARLVVGAV